MVPYADYIKKSKNPVKSLRRLYYRTLTVALSTLARIFQKEEPSTDFPAVVMLGPDIFLRAPLGRPLVGSGWPRGGGSLHRFFPSYLARTHARNAG